MREVTPQAPQNLDHLVPAELTLPSVEEVRALADERIEMMPQYATPSRRAVLLFQNHVLEVKRRFDGLRQQALEMLRSVEATRVVRLYECELAESEARSEVERLRQETHDLSQQVNDYAAEAGLTVNPNQRNPYDIRNAVRIFLGGGPVKEGAEAGTTEVDRARATRDGAVEAQMEARREAEVRAETRRRQAEQEAEAEADRLAAEARARDEAKNQSDLIRAQTETDRLKAIQESKKGFPIWLLGILEWLIVAVLAIVPALVLAVCFGTAWGAIKHGTVSKINILRPETLFQAGMGVPTLYGIGVTITLVIALHIIALMVCRTAGSWVAKILATLGVILWLSEVAMETYGFYLNHLLAVANANAISHTMNASPWLVFIPFGLLAGTPFLLAKVLFAWYKESEKDRIFTARAGAKDEARKEAEAVLARHEMEVKRQREERVAEAESEAQRRQTELHAEAEAAERLARELAQADTILREAETKAAERQEAFEQMVSDFMRHDPSTKEAVRIAGRLVEKEADLAQAIEALKSAEAEVESYRQAKRELPSGMLTELLTARAAVVRAYQEVNILLGLAEAAPPTAATPTPSATAVTPSAPSTTTPPPTPSTYPAEEPDLEPMSATPESSGDLTATGGSPRIRNWLEEGPDA